MNIEISKYKSVNRARLLSDAFVWLATETERINEWADKHKPCKAVQDQISYAVSKAFENMFGSKIYCSLSYRVIGNQYEFNVDFGQFASVVRDIPTAKLIDLE